MSGPNSEPLPAARIFNATAYCLFGPLIWSLHLGVVYVVHEMACHGAAQSSRSIAAFVLSATVLATAALIAAWLTPKRLAALLRFPTHDVPMQFLTPVMRWLVILSICGIVWAGAGALLVASCAQ